MLYTIDLFLSDLSKEAVTTKNLLLAEFAKIKNRLTGRNHREKIKEVDDVIPKKKIPHPRFQ